VSAADAPRRGWCAREVAEELPGLALLEVDTLHTRAQALTAPAPADVREPLHMLADRFRGARAVSVRREPVPGAYRAFFRQIGLDPDVARTPVEAAVAERMLSGGLPGAGLLADVLLIALLDTGVPVWALDADTVEGELGIRASAAGELLARPRSATTGESDAQPLERGTLVVADSTAALSRLFCEPARAHAAGSATRRLRLYAVQVPGVPSLYAQEALWSVASALERG